MEVYLKYEPKIVLINPPGDILIDEYLEPPLGLLSIASFIQERIGLRVVILDLTKYNVEQAKTVISENKAEIYGFTVYCTKWHIVKELIQHIKEDYGKFSLIVVGGPNPTALPNETLQFEGINIVVCGEGEKAFCQIIKMYEKNIFNFETKQIVYGERLNENEFPMIDRSFVESPEHYGRRILNKPVINLEASRGCLNKCIFCNSVVTDRGKKDSIVGKSIEKVFQEVMQSQRSGYDMFRFNDDSFTYATYQNGLLDKLRDKNIHYRIFANAKHLTREVLLKLKESGCFHISVGIESYNPKNLRIIGKNTRQEEICFGINYAQEIGIMIRVYFIVGLPYDNKDNIRKYMEMVAQEVHFSEYTVYPLIPYPGSLIWKYPEKFGYTITNKNFNEYIQIGKEKKTVFALRHRNFDENDIESWVTLSEDILEKYGKVQTINSKVV